MNQEKFSMPMLAGSRRLSPRVLLLLSEIASISEVGLKTLLIINDQKRSFKN
jgi:hypothetical protein